MALAVVANETARRPSNNGISNSGGVALPSSHNQLKPDQIQWTGKVAPTRPITCRPDHVGMSLVELAHLSPLSAALPLRSLSTRTFNRSHFSFAEASVLQRLASSRNLLQPVRDYFGRQEDLVGIFHVQLRLESNSRKGRNSGEGGPG